MNRDERLIYLTSVVGSFQGRLLAARLSAEGVESELRGSSDGPYPLPSEVAVFVPESSLTLAREILLADAVDEAFSPPEPGGGPAARRAWRRWIRRRGARSARPQ